MLYFVPTAQALPGRAVSFLGGLVCLPMLRSKVSQIGRRVHKIPLFYWIVTGFLAAYLLIFIGPVFLRTRSMQFYPPAPAAQHLGIDLKIRLSWSAYWIDPSLQIPDGDGNIFPPLADTLFAPLLALGFSTAFRILTVISVLTYAFVTLRIPALLAGEVGISPIAVLVCATGLISYGLLFELERGQWNVITMCLTLVALWLFHRRPRFRALAYIIYVLSVQLKFYPIVFIFLFVVDWDDWRENLRRLALLAGANVALLFVQGGRGIQLLLSGLRDWSNFIWVWEGNPSIASAVGLMSRLAETQGWSWVVQNAGLFQLLLTLVVIFCLLATILVAHRPGNPKPSPYYLAAAAIGCLLIPSGGYDYRLSMIGAPLAYLLLVESNLTATSDFAPGGLARRLAVLVLCFAYGTTLVSFSQKPFYLANNFPALFIMVILVTALALTSAPAVVHQVAPSPSAARPSGFPQSG